MQLQVVLVLVLAVQFCNSAWNINTRIQHVNQKPKNVTVSIKNSNFDRSSVREDIYLSTTQLISKYGYPAEIHTVITKDGYILELHRIPRPRAVPVLLVHGLFDASSAWVVTGPEKAFAYLLSDLGYDVWMANTRGNTYSKKHITLSPSTPDFWNFTFHEIGAYDIPATIDHILQKTNFKRLQYIGHSQGASTFFIMCSLRPEYNRKIISMQALAPAAFIGEGKSPIIEIASYFHDQIINYFNSLGTFELLTSSNVIKSMANYLCKNGKITQSLCSNIIFLITGFDDDQINSTMIPVLLGHYPAGASVKQVDHFAQIIQSGRFRQFDYGKMGNLQKYGRKTPPDYDLRKVVAKVAIHYGANDYLAVPKDIEKLRQSLPNVVGKYLVDFPKFNHVDFLWAIDARELVYYKVIRLMQLIRSGKL